MRSVTIPMVATGCDEIPLLFVLSWIRAIKNGIIFINRFLPMVEKDEQHVNGRSMVVNMRGQKSFTCE